MKIKTKVVIGDQQRDFYIPCGTGDKNFKWLTLVTTQRFANATPNGSLRWRDNFAGITEKAQYTCASITLPSGDEPEPSEMINYYLRDGDEVTINLADKQCIRGINGSPKKTKWTSALYSSTILGEFKQEDKEPEENDEDEDEDEDGEDEEEDDDEYENGLGYGRSNADTVAMKMQQRNDRQTTIVAKADFMRLILQSQMVNKKKTAHFIETEWSKVSRFIPNLKADQNYLVTEIFIAHCDVLFELFQVFSPEGSFLLKDFVVFFEDCDVFPVATCAFHANKIYFRICKFMKVDEKGFSFGCFLASLLLSAQLKYIDTLDNNTPSFKDSKGALTELIEKKILPICSNLQQKSVLKEEFCTDECLSSINDSYQGLRSVFDKLAAKVRDIPSTVPIEDIREVMYVANLTDDKEPDKDFPDQDLTPTLLKTVRLGTLYGREPEDPEDEPLDIDEFTFNEFVEAIARAGFYRFNGKTLREVIAMSESVPGSTTNTAVTTDPDDELDRDEEYPMTPIECMLRAVTHVLESAVDPHAHRKPAFVEKGGGRGYSRGNKNQRK